MKLRKYAPEDAAVIARWLRSEEEVYLWSADRIGAFPVPEDALNKIYATVPKDTEFVPVTAVDGEGRPVGHLFLRIKQKEPERIVRIGFVILSPAVRGQGNGERMLIQALLYARNVLQAEKASLGVFLNNPSALHCYENVGFVPVGEHEICAYPVGTWECLEMEMVIPACGCFGKKALAAQKE